MATAEDMVVVGEATDGESAIHLPEVASEVPDVLIVDVRMPGVDGLEVTRQIHQRYPDVNVVIITAYDDPRSASQAVRAGARAYVLKTAEPEEILETIRMVAHGHVVFDSSVLQALSRESEQQTLQLPRREIQVLQLLSRGKGNREIAEQLDVSVETVKTHVERLFKHLGVTSRTDAVAKALRTGLIE
jgi:DNA-binding NarL/FixJ family response regulator